MSVFWGNDSSERERRARIEAERALLDNQNRENIRDFSIILVVVAAIGLILWGGHETPKEAARGSAPVGLAAAGPSLPSDRAPAK